MKLVKILALLAAVAFVGVLGTAKDAEAGYYGGWNYYGSYGYHYTNYYYTPYHYHYCLYYPSYPRYVYYYNPYKRVFWGRFDLEGKPGQQYSMLAEKDRKAKLSDIPESAFPAPGPMPVLPDVAGNEQIELPPAPPAPAKK